MTLDSFNMNGHGKGQFGDRGASKAAFPPLWEREGRIEAAMHAKNVHAPEVVRERKRREKHARYLAMKDEMLAARAASGTDVSVPPTTNEGNA